MDELPTKDGGSRTLSTVDASFEVVRALRAMDGATAAELVDRLDASKSTVYNHLATLRQNKLIVKNGDSYELSLEFLLLGKYVRDENVLYKVGKSEVDSLAEETGEYVHLSTEQHGRRISLHKAQGEKAVGVEYQQSKLQKPDHLHTSATGKAILAELSRDRVDEICDEYGLPAKTDETITDRDELFDAIDAIQERGYSYNDEEEIEGLRAVGAAVTDRNGSVLGALSISGPTSRLTGETFRKTVPEKVTSTANIIEVNINMTERSTEND
jgi:DNA-binding IclR family transcriptional regulator